MAIYHIGQSEGGATLSNKIINGVKWTGFTVIFGQIILLIKTPILARLLSPSDFGLMGMLLTVVAFASPITEMGLGSAIIQKNDITKLQLSTLYWLNLLVGVVMFVFVLLISPLIADFFDEQRLVQLLPLLALVFLISPVGSQFEKLMEKELNFGLPAKARTAAVLAGFFISVTLALFGYGVYSLIFGRLGGAVVSSSIFTIHGIKYNRPSMAFSLGQSKSLLLFGAYQVSERLIKILSTNLDKLFIGRFLGAELLGYYTVAHTLVVIPVMTLNPNITKVTFPVFSIIQKDLGKMNEYFTLAMKALMTTNFPIYIGLIITAPTFFKVFFGAGWEPAVPILQILSFGALMWAISNPVGSILLAKGRADVSLILNLFRALVLLGGMGLAYMIGRNIIWIAFGIVMSRYVTDPFIHLYMNKCFGIDYRKIIKHLIRVVVFSILMSLSVYSLDLFNLKNVTFELILKVCLGCSVYSALVAVFDKETREILKMFLQK